MTLTREVTDDERTGQRRSTGRSPTQRGVAFTRAERDELGLVGQLPDAVLTLEQQTQRAYEQLRGQPMVDHLAELLPIVYDPTVGEAIKRYSHEYRRRILETFGDRYRVFNDDMQ